MSLTVQKYWLKLRRQSVAFLVLAMSANALSYVYQLVMARLLNPAEYAVVLAIVSFIAILLFPSNAYQAAVAVGTGHISAKGSFADAWPFALRAAYIGGSLALGLALILLAMGDPVRTIFGFEGSWVLNWLALTFFLSLILSSLRGAFQGGHRFALLGALMFVEAATRVVISILLVILGYGVAGATAGFAIGFAIAAVMAVWLLWPRHHDTTSVNTESLWITLRDQLQAVPATFAVFGVQAIDVVIANYKLATIQMEPFSAAALAGRVTFYAAFVLGLLMLPRFTEMFSRKQWRTEQVHKSFFVMAGISIGPLVAAFLVPEVIHNLLVGPRYTSDPTLLRTYLVGTGFLAWSLFLTYFLISAKQHKIWRVLVPVSILQALAYLTIATTTLHFAIILCLGGATSCSYLAYSARKLIKTLSLQPSMNESDSETFSPSQVL